MKTIDLTKLTKEEIERDFMTRGDMPFEVIKMGLKGSQPIAISIYLKSTNEDIVVSLTKTGEVMFHPYSHNCSLIPRPVETFERDEKVMVKVDRNVGREIPKYYSHKGSVHHYVYEHGNSWDNNSIGDMIVSIVRKPTPEELAK